MTDYWTDLDERLAAVAPAPVLERDVRRSTADYNFFLVRLSSIGMRGAASYRIAGYLSVPTRGGVHPALLELPRHGSVNHTPHSHERERYIVFTVLHRGQRLADVPYRASYPGLLTDGIEAGRDWIYDGIVADCLRGAEFLASVAGVDVTRIGAVGDDLAVLTAARRSMFAAVRVDSLLLTDMLDRSASTVSYPLEELNDLRRRGGDVSAVEQTIAPFDPLVHAPAVSATTLVSGSALNPDAHVTALLAALGEHGEHFDATHRDGLDADGRDAWLATELGVPPRSRFATGSQPLPGEAGAA